MTIAQGLCDSVSDDLAHAARARFQAEAHLPLREGLVPREVSSFARPVSDRGVLEAAAAWQCLHGPTILQSYVTLR